MKAAKILVSIFFVVAALAITAQPAFAAKLALSPASATKNVGNTFNVDIVLDTEGEAVSGATALINYDKAKLEVVGSVKPETTNLGQVLTNTINTSTGQIRYDAGNLGSPYTGRSVIATITFKAIATGVAQVNFVFNSGSTTNTSAVAAASGPVNLLSEGDGDGGITDANFTINASGATTDTEDTLTEAGVVEDTILMLLGGFTFLGIGAFLFTKASLLRL